MELIERGLTRILCVLYKWFNGTLFRRKYARLYGIPLLRQRHNIYIGKYCTINPRVFIHGGGGVRIGNYVTLSYGVTILSTSLDVHNWKALQNQKRKNHTFGKVKIGDNVWICANTTILQDVQIANGCIIAAGSVVTKSLLEENCVYAGVPAKKVNTICE